MEKENSKLYKKINQELKLVFLKIDSYFNEYDCNLESADSAAFTLNKSFAVKFQNTNLISFHSYSSSFTEGSAHPNNEYKTMNFNLLTGELIYAKEIFKINGALKKLIKKLIREDLQRQSIESEPLTENLQFYITVDSIVFINLFDIYALSSTEVKIPWKQLEKFIKVDFLLLLRAN